MSRFETGWDKLKQVDGEAGEKVIRSLEELAPDLAKYIVEFVFGDIYCRSGLDLKERQLLAIASLAAMGGCEPQLAVHIEAGLHVGLTPQEIIETVIQLAAYAGFPRALNAIFTVKSVFDKRKLTVAALTENELVNRYEAGLTRLRTLDDAPAVIEALSEIAPDLGRYVVEFGYGDIYNRKGLALRSRQFITLAAITALGGAEAQLKFHVGAGLQVGLTPNEIMEGLMQTIWVVGFPRVLNAVFAAKNIFDQRGVKPVWNEN